MAASDMERSISDELKEIRETMRAVLAAVERRQPERFMYTPKEAAAALGIGKTKMSELIRSKVIITRPLNGMKMVPASELRRLGEVEQRKKEEAMRPKPLALTSLPASSKKKSYDPGPLKDFLAERKRNRRRVA